MQSVGNGCDFLLRFAVERFIDGESKSSAGTAVDTNPGDTQLSEPVAQRGASFAGQKLGAPEQQFQISAGRTHQMGNTMEDQSAFDKR